MPRRAITVAELGTAAGLDPDETLLLLWDAGLDDYHEPTDRLHHRDQKAAQKAIGLPTRSELTTPAYWQEKLHLSDEEFAELLVAAGIRIPTGARRLPKGAIGKLRRASRSILGSVPLVEPTEPKTASREELFEWRVVGRPIELRLLSNEEVEGIHWELVRDFAADSDPIDPPGVRDDHLLGSAVFRQHTASGEHLKYPTPEMAAGALLHSIVHDHPFHNGNKRTALVAMIVLLDLNGVMLICSEEDLFKFVLRVARHQVVPPGKYLSDREMIWIAEWIRQDSRDIRRGDRPIQWRALRQILLGFGCGVEQPRGVGNRLYIWRDVSEPRRFGRSRKIRFTTQVKYSDDGREALVDTVKKIRRDLQLDEEHGIDSLMFYRCAGPFPGEFILRYRKTLKRLARL